MNSHMLVALGKEEVVHVCVWAGGGVVRAKRESGMWGRGCREVVRYEKRRRKKRSKFYLEKHPNSKFYLERYTVQNST